MMTGRIRGLYESLITEALDVSLRDEGARVERQKLRPAETADRFALHLARVVERAVAAVPDAARVESGIALARELVALIASRASVAKVGPDAPAAVGSVLRNDEMAVAPAPPVVAVEPLTAEESGKAQPWDACRRANPQQYAAIHASDARVRLLMERYDAMMAQR